MNRDSFQTELDRVCFTPAGREALVDAMMRGAAVRSPRRRKWAKRGLAIGLTAAVLLGSAVASAGSIWSRFFGDLDEDQQFIIDTLSHDLPAAECHGVVMKPLAALGDQDFYFLMLEIQFPEDAAPPVDERAVCGFDDLSKGENLTLTDSAGNVFLLVDCGVRWLPRTDSSSLTAVITLTSDGVVDFTDGTDKLLHIPGLRIWYPETDEEWSITGSWDFNIGTATGGIESRELDVSGVTSKHKDVGTLTLDYLRVSSLGIRWRFHWDGEVPLGMEPPGSEIGAVVMKNGHEERIYGLDKWDYDGKTGEVCAPFEVPIDLEKASYIRWGTAQIPLN